MLHHMVTILVCYGGHLEPKMVAKIQKSSDLGEIWFPSRLRCCELISIVWEPYNIISCCVCSVSYYVPQTKFRETYCVCSVSYYYVPQTKFGRHNVFAPFLIKFPSKVWGLIVFAPFLIIIIIILPILLLAVSLSDQILRDEWSDLY
jgi:hypothetical protein